MGVVTANHPPTFLRNRFLSMELLRATVENAVEKPVKDPTLFFAGYGQRKEVFLELRGFVSYSTVCDRNGMTFPISEVELVFVPSRCRLEVAKRFALSASSVRRRLTIASNSTKDCATNWGSPSFVTRSGSPSSVNRVEISWRVREVSSDRDFCIGAPVSS